jgi:hypothetical protein
MPLSCQDCDRTRRHFQTAWQAGSAAAEADRMSTAQFYDGLAAAGGYRRGMDMD